MKARAILAATAMLVTSFNPILITPAFATPPINDTTGLTPQEVCEANLKPNDPNSDFMTEPQNVSVGDWVTVGNPVLGDAIGDPYGVGTPTASGVTFNGTYIRHGGSPNVWGGASSTLTYPQTGQLYETVLNQERTTTFDCFVWKIVGHDTLVDPAGLQSTGNSSVEQQQISGPNQEVITEDDFVVLGNTTVDVLICISPNAGGKKPGTWRQMHGFLGSCTAASTAAGTSFIPSHNNPTTDPDISF